MNRFGISVLTAAICLLFALEIRGQSQRPTDVRPAGTSPTLTKLVEPESPGTSSIVSPRPQAVVPRLMKFSGLLHDATGKPLSGTVDVTFALYNTEAGGSPLWFETQTVQADELGRYTALLGAMHTDGLPLDLFTSGEVRWLGIQIGLEVEQPRVLLVSVPYALKAGDAETLGGKPASAYMLSDGQSGTATGATTTSTAVASQSGTTKKSRTANTTPLTACASVTSGGAATVNSIARFTTACNIESSVIAQSGSNVGIGTLSPTVALDVSGNNAGMLIEGTGTHQVKVAGATIGRLGQDSAGLFLSSDSLGSAVRILTNNGSPQEWMRVTSAGNVGIGTTTPAYKLDVVGGSARVTNPSGTTQLVVSGSAASGRLGEDAAGFFFASDTNGQSLRFLTNNGALHEWLRVTSAGNVGIATTTPAAKLEVNGTAQFDQPVTFNSTQTISGNNGSQIMSVTQAGTGSAAAFTNTSTSSSGYLGTSHISATGVYGVSTGYGVFGDGAIIGVVGNNTATGAQGHLGGNDLSSRPTGVYGYGPTSTSRGIVGYNAGSGSYGEVATEVNGTPTGIYGHGPNGYGVYGDSSTNGNGAGVYGTSDVGFGVEGVGTSTADAGFFYNQSGGYAGYFYGDVDVNGALAVAGKITAGTKDFKIDHPLDPEGKYLYHASVESSEMMNIYSGNVELDSSGAAWVDLPRWFDAVNGDFRYQLTSLGKPQPGLYVASEISQNRFQIAGGIPNGKVSWQVAGVRHDPYAIAHPMQVEEDKPAQKRGTYLHPEAFGQPVTRSEGYLKIRNLRFPSNTQDTSTKGVISEAKH